MDNKSNTSKCGCSYDNSTKEQEKMRENEKKVRKVGDTEVK